MSMCVRDYLPLLKLLGGHEEIKKHFRNEDIWKTHWAVLVSSFMPYTVGRGREVPVTRRENKCDMTENFQVLIPISKTALINHTALLLMVI